MKTKQKRLLTALFLCSVVGLVGCGPSKQMIRLQNQLDTLRKEKEREVSRLQKEKFEAMQVQSVAIEKKQKDCQASVVHMRTRHRQLSFRVAKATRKINILLMQILSETTLMPFQEEPEPKEPPKAPQAPPQPTPQTGTPETTPPTGATPGETTPGATSPSPPPAAKPENKPAAKNNAAPTK